MNMEGVHEAADTPICIRRCAPFTPEERAKVQEQMQATYDTFVEKAAAGRNTTPERIDAIGQGRVWTGAQGKQIGLVDELGGLERALAIAKQRAKIAPDAEVELVVYPAQEVVLRHRAKPVRRAPTRPARSPCCSGFAILAPLQTLTAPLRVFRRGEPLAIMPNVFTW